MNKVKKHWQDTLALMKDIVNQLDFKQRVLFLFLSVLLVIGSIGTLIFLSHTTTVQVPSRGGSFSEGIVGTPRFINPLFATSDPDKDLVEIIYAGLMTRSGSEFIPELTHSYVVSEDGLSYTFILRDDLVFHDNKPLTAYDIDFTIKLVQNSATKSPLRADWLDVTSTVINEKTIQLSLSRPYGGFLALTTLGIIPQHIFKSISPDQIIFSEYNINAIGSGPYKIQRVSKDSIGIPKEIILKSSPTYTLGRPYLRKIIFTFFSTINDAQKDLTKRNIDGLYNVPSSTITDFEHRGFTLHSSPLPHIFALFFNQSNNTIFLDHDVLQAIDMVIPKSAIVKRIFNGYGHILCNPTPLYMTGSQACSEAYTNYTTAEKISRATALLRNAGWKRNTEGILAKDGRTLEFSLSLPNNPELKETAAMIATSLSDIGITTQQQIFEPGNFDQDVIRPRSYQSLLFGQIYEHDTDIFAFWHSSGKNDPGFNIGLYANSNADTILEKIINEDDDTKRNDAHDSLLPIFSQTIPAVFLYSPDALYVTDSRIYNINIQGIVSPHHRFSSIHTWYRYTERIWKPFIKKQKLY